MRTFQVVARLMSFNKAAKALNYAQSTVSAQIKSLEESLQAQLFERLDKHVILTEAGNKLLVYSTRILELTEETETEVKGEQATYRHLNIRIPETLAVYRMVPIIKEFQKKYPDVQLTFSPCSFNTLGKDLKQSIYDLAFLYTDSYVDSSLSIKFLGFEPLVLVSSPDHILSKKTSICPKDLERQQLLLTRTECSYRMMFHQLLAKEKVESVKIMEVNSLDTIKEFSAAGLGVSILPLISVEDELKEKKLIKLPWEEEDLETQILMIWHKDKWIHPVLKKFMDLTAERFEKINP